jgi:hypothetical protein
MVDGGWWMVEMVTTGGFRFLATTLRLTFGPSWAHGGPKLGPIMGGAQVQKPSWAHRVPKLRPIMGGTHV